MPGLAPFAKQQGCYVARAVKRRLRRIAARPFRYRGYGLLAAIGRNRAIAQFGRVHMTGFPAWADWAAAHIFPDQLPQSGAGRHALGDRTHHAPAHRPRDPLSLGKESRMSDT